MPVHVRILSPANRKGEDMDTLADTTTSWALDPAHTSVTFRVKHMMVTNVRGEFQSVSGTAVWNPAHPEKSSVDVTIDVASVNTRDEKRDAHLRSADFFDVEKFPTMTFRSKGITRKKDGQLELVGELTIRGTTRIVVLDVEGPTPPHADPWGGTRIGASARTSIKRSEFGMMYNSVLEAGGVLIGDEVTIEIDAEFIQKKEG
jgi:polyisoprenoid-binding protein YceI